MQSVHSNTEAIPLCAPVVLICLISFLLVGNAFAEPVKSNIDTEWVATHCLRVINLDVDSGNVTTEKVVDIGSNPVHSNSEPNKTVTWSEKLQSGKPHSAASGLRECK